MKHQNLAKIFLFPSWRNTGNFGVGENAKQTTSTSEVKVRATTVLPKGTLGIHMLMKELDGSLGYLILLDILLDTWIFHDQKKKRKNVLLLILMQSTCKYYSKGKVKMVVILPEVLVVQMLKSKWIDICIVIIAVITTVAIFVCLCAYFPVCSMPEYSAGREQKKVMDFLERDWLAVVSHWIWVLRTKPGS